MNKRRIIICGLFLFIAHHSFAQGVITTIGGNGITQYIGDGWPATNYSLALPVGICLDRNGSLIIADNADARIRKINLQDSLFTIADSVGPGYSGDGGMKDTARFKSPAGICLDTAGNLIIADRDNHAVRKIDRITGLVSTIAGTGYGGASGDDGPATDARLNHPVSVCVDKKGNLYIADKDNLKIRKVDALSGMISTYAGTGSNGFAGDNGAATAAKLSYPAAVCTDTAGNLFISDYGNFRIRKVNAASGVITTIAGTIMAGYNGENTTATATRLNGVNAMVMNRAGYLYFSDIGNNRVRVLDPEGYIKTIAGSGGYGFSGDGGSATDATFNGPTGVYIDDTGTIYIADGGNSVIRKIIPETTGIDNVLPSEGVNIYPNPTSGVVVIEFKKGIQGARVEVYNAYGQIVAIEEVNGKETNVDLTGAPPGIYLLRLVCANQVCVMREIVKA